MICPECQGRMHTVDRQGLHIEQCDRCRGIFLDHGELEQMLVAEQRFYGGGYADSPRPYGRGHHADSPRPYRGRPDSPRPYGHAGHHRDSPRPYRGHRDSPRPYKGHRRGFLGELFG
ncbi:MAG: zf-TFIIB domain-containing protein [Pseudonocardia sp.]